MQYISRRLIRHAIDNLHKKITIARINIKLKIINKIKRYMLSEFYIFE